MHEELDAMSTVENAKTLPHDGNKISFLVPLLRAVSFIALLLSVSVSAVAQSAENTNASLSPEAKHAFNRGLAAAKAQNWDAAIESFTKAQYLASEYPPILFNLGLAHAKAGHRVAAEMWLHAYLSSAPDAPNADAVRHEIGALKAAVLGNIGIVFDQAIAVASSYNGKRDLPVDKLMIAQDMAGSGQFEDAVTLVRSTETELDSNLTGCQYHALSAEYAYALSKAGDIAGALLVANGEPDAPNPHDHRERCSAGTESLSREQIMIGVWTLFGYFLTGIHDISGAEDAFNHISDARERQQMLSNLHFQTTQIEREQSHSEQWISLAQSDESLFVDSQVQVSNVESYCKTKNSDERYRCVSEQAARLARAQLKVTALERRQSDEGKSKR